MSKKPKLTRRRALAGLGTIGAGAVVGGAGTMAWLNDKENVNGTSMTAGTVDLQVDVDAYADRGIAGDINISDNDSFESDIELGASLGDLKPGDTGKFKFCLKVKSNPAWVWINAELTANGDGHNTEPELDVDTDIGAGAGDLAANIDAELKFKDGATIIDGSLKEILESLYADGGVRLDYGEHGYFPANNKVCVILEWEIPTDVGNIIQGDVAKFDVMFAAEQRRHNDNPTSPF